MSGAGPSFSQVSATIASVSRAGVLTSGAGITHHPPFSAVTKYCCPFFVPRIETRPFSSALTNVICFGTWGISHARAALVKSGETLRTFQKNLQHWAEKACAPLARTSVAWVAAGSPHAVEIALKWIDSPQDVIFNCAARRTVPKPPGRGKLPLLEGIVF